MNLTDNEIIKALRLFRNTIDNLVKEMVGEESPSSSSFPA